MLVQPAARFDYSSPVQVSRNSRARREFYLSVRSRSLYRWSRTKEQRLALYLLLGADDPSSSATLLTSGGQVIDDLATAIKDLGGTLHSLAATSGQFTVAGFVDLPDSAAAVALALTQTCFGRDLTLTPAVPAHEWHALITSAKKITMLTATPPPAPDGASQ